MSSSPRSASQASGAHSPRGQSLNRDSLAALDALSPTSSFTMSNADGSTVRGSSRPASTVGGEPTNVRVLVRVRPFNATEIRLSTGSTGPLSQSGSFAGSPASPISAASSPLSAGTLEPVLHVSPAHVVTVLDKQAGYASKEAFQFDEVLWSVPPEQFPDVEPGVSIATQATVYESVGIPAVDAVLSGRNSCIFAYGQTGSGKTHTMMGYPGDPGIIPRIVQRLFELVAQSPAHLEHEVTASFLEIYNEKVRDLLDAAALKAHARDGNFCDRKVRHSAEHGTFVEGLRRTPIKSAAECDSVIEAGTTYRTTAATKMNDTSSRSHAILQLHVKKVDRHSGFARHALLNLVDLAGSERVRMSGVSGSALKEATNINKSLSTLRRVIDTLLENAQRSARARPAVVPYRESMLTWVLSDSLGGNCQTVMLGMMSPHERCLEDTVNTLRYCLRAKAITCNVRVNEEKCKVVVSALKAEMEAMKRQQEEDDEQQRLENEARERRLADEAAAAEEAQRKRKAQGVASARAQAVLKRQTEALQRLREQLRQKKALASESNAFEAEASDISVLVAEQEREMEAERERAARAEELRREAEAAIAAAEAEREEVVEAEREAQRRAHAERQKELANVFRLATRLGRDGVEMAALTEENRTLRAACAKAELHVARLHRRGGSAMETADVLRMHLAAAADREREVTRAVTDAVEAKARRMRELKLASDALTAEAARIRAAIEATREELDGAYAALEAANAEGRATVRVAGQRLNAAIAEGCKLDLQLDEAALERDRSLTALADARRRHDAAEARHAAALSADAAATAEQEHTQLDIDALRDEVDTLQAEVQRCADELPVVRSDRAAAARELERLRAEDCDLRRYLRGRESRLLPDAILAINRQVDPASEATLHVAVPHDPSVRAPSPAARGSESPTRRSQSPRRSAAELFDALSDANQRAAHGSQSRHCTPRRSTSVDAWA